MVVKPFPFQADIAYKVINVFMGNHLVTGNDPLRILMRVFFCWPFSQIGLKGLDSQSVNSGIVMPSTAPGSCLLIGSFLPCRMIDGHLPPGPLLPEVQTGWCFCIFSHLTTAGEGLCSACWSVQRTILPGPRHTPCYVLLTLLGVEAGHVACR